MVLEEDSLRSARRPQQTIMTAWCLSFTAKRLPLRARTHACGHRLQVLHHKRGTSVSLLGGGQTVFSVSRRSRRETHECWLSALAVSWRCSMMVAILSTPAVDSMPLMWRQVFPALLHSASRMPCLISCSHKLSGCNKARCLPIKRRMR